MFRNTLTVAMLVLVTFAATFVAPQEAHARTLTQAAYDAAMQAHRFAQTKTQQAGRLQARLSGEASKFSTGMASSNASTRYYAKRSFIIYLRSLQNSYREAIRAHDNAARRWFAYNRASGTTNGNANITALQEAIVRFQAAINAVQGAINSAGNAS